jgi:tetratricopeptide (TPR) repeat protein
MNAIVSGRSGRALILDGESLKSFDLDAPSTIVSRHRSDLPYLFGEAADLRTIENTTIESVERELRMDCHFTWALDLALISLDAEIEDDIRSDALEDLEQLLAESATRQRLENVLYSKPLPEDADLKGALDHCDPQALSIVFGFLKRLEERQPSILSVHHAWEIIPTRTFGGQENRETFEHVAVKEGLFHSLATLDTVASISSFQLKAGLTPSIQRLPNHRQVLLAWTAPFRGTRETPNVVKEEEEPSLEEEQFRKRHRIDRRAVFREAVKKKSIIVEAMRRRDLARVDDLVDELVAYHQSYSESQHTAKSLCDLAMEAKAIGLKLLQLSLTERSISIAPGDGWSWVQHADALLGLERLDEALKAYDQAEVFGKDVMAKTGRAEVLKAKGQFAAALAMFDEIIRQHPEDVVAKNGRAEVLKAQGQFLAALAAFDEVIRQHPEDVVAKNGRAEVFKAQGQFPAALAAFDEVIRQHPEDMVAKTGRAEVLKTQGQYTAALAIFDEIIRQDPEDVVAKTGRAEVLKAQGHFAAALTAFDEVIRQHPHEPVTRNGRSCVLVALGRYDEALESLPTTAPIAFEGWIAYHIKGMCLLRTGETAKALKIFNDGLQNCPFSLQTEYFRSALALSWLRGQDFRKAGETLDVITSPLLQQSANVIRIHAFGAQGNRQRALKAYEDLAAAPHLLTDELTQELHHQYVLLEEPTKDEEWIFDREVRIFLRAEAA